MAKEKYLIVKGTSGLGNRLMSLTTGILYAKMTGRTLIIDWGLGKYPGDPEGTFYKFFRCPASKTIEDSTFFEGMSVTPRIWEGRLNKHFGEMKQEGHEDLSIDVSVDDYDEDIVVFSFYAHLTLRLRPLLSMKLPRYSKLDNLQLLRKVLRTEIKLKESIRREVEEFRAENLTRNSVGVHVRHSDMKIDVDQFFPVVDKLIKWKKVEIFLSTDNRDVENRFRERYDKVITTDKWLPGAGEKAHLNPECPDPIRAEEEAIIDMFLLAGCRYMVFSPKSSFGLVASLFSISPRYRKIAVEQGMETRLVHLMKAFRDRFFGRY